MWGETVKRKGGIKLMFVESICDQEEVSDFPTVVVVVYCLNGRALPFRGFCNPIACVSDEKHNSND